MSKERSQMSNVGLSDVEQRIKIYKIIKEMAITNASESLDNVINTLAGAAEEIRKFKKTMEGEQTLVEKAEVLNWAINHVASNILGNCRLDMVAQAQAKLVSLQTEEEEK